MKPNVTKKRSTGATGASTAKAQQPGDAKKKGAMAMQASSAGGSFGARDVSQNTINPNKTGGVS